MRTLGLLIGAVALVGASASAQFDEHGVKAAFVRNFTTFVTWPAEVLSPGGTTTVCVMNERELTIRLSQLAVTSPRIRVRPVSGLPDLEGCHVAVVPVGDVAHVRDIEAQNLGRGLLTIAEADGDAPTGAVIGMFVANNRVGFDVDLESADRAGVQVSSKLLSLARRVHARRQTAPHGVRPSEGRRP